MRLPALCPCSAHVFDTLPVSYFLAGGRAAEADSPVWAAFAARFSAVAHGNFGDMRMKPA